MQKCINHEEYWFHVNQFILVSANSYFNFHILFRYIMYYTFHCELPHYTVHVSLPFLLIHLKAGTVHSGNSSVIGQSNLPAVTTDTAQKIKFSIVNVTKSTENCRFCHSYWRNPWRKTSFFVQFENEEQYTLSNTIYIGFQNSHTFLWSFLW